MTRLRLRNQRRGFALRCAEVLIGAGIVASAATGLAHVVGPNGLGVAQFEPSWPFVGSSAYPMAVEATFDDDAGVDVTHAPVTVNTSDGTRDAATGGGGLEIFGPITGRVSYMNPSLPERWAWVAWQAALPILTAVSLIVVLRLVRSVRVGSPFTARNAVRLRALALLVGGGGSLVSLVGALVPNWLLGTSGAAEIVHLRGYVSLVPLVAGVLIAILAEVWQTGIEMNRDLDGTV